VLFIFIVFLFFRYSCTNHGGQQPRKRTRVNLILNQPTPAAPTTTTAATTTAIAATATIITASTTAIAASAAQM
jgi:hypothetical protein